MNKAAIANMLVSVNAFAPFRFLNRSKLPILTYHRFSEREEFGKTSAKALETHLEYLAKNYRVLSLSDAVRYLQDGEPLPAGAAVITIDDGYLDFYRHAFPVLKKFGMPATFYVVTNFVDGKCWIWTDKARYILSKTADETLSFEIGNENIERRLTDRRSRFNAAAAVNAELKKLPDEKKDDVLIELAKVMKVEIPDLPPPEFAAINWDQARELSAGGIDIGSHTANHPLLTNVDAERLGSELKISRLKIQDELQYDNVNFCYPNGNVSTRESDAVESAGYASAVTTEIRLCENNDNRFLLPRLDAEPEMHRFIQATSGFDRMKKAI